MKRTDSVIVKFKCRKQKNSVMYKRKNLGNKSQELNNLKFSGRLFVSESMSHEHIVNVVLSRHSMEEYTKYFM